MTTEKFPLFEAIRDDDEKKIYYLFANSPGCVNQLIYETPTIRESSIHVAVWHGNQNIVKLLIKMGAKVNAFASIGCFGRITVAHIATWIGDVPMLKLLKGWGCKMDEKDALHNTPLQEAKRLGKKEAEEYLQTLEDNKYTQKS